MTVLPFLASILEGWLLVRSISPARDMQPRWAGVALEACLGAGIGIGLISFLYFLLLLLGIASPASILVVHLLLLAFLTTVYLRIRRTLPTRAPAAHQGRPSFRWNWLIALMILICLVPVVIPAIETSLDTPHGGWDAWAIWNLRARYLAGPGEVWRNAMSSALKRTHPDYPLLISAFIAHNWKTAGGEFDTAVPIAATFLFGGGVVVMVIASLALLRGTSLGLLAGLTLLANVSFLEHLAAQYSDVPLGLYYLGTLVLVLLSDTRETSYGPVLMLGGSFAAYAAWTKDEGIVFAAVALVCVAAYHWLAGGWTRFIRRFPWFLAGALPGLLLATGFKLFLAPKVNPMVTQTPAEAVTGALTWTRWWNLLRGLWQSLLDAGGGIAHPFLIVVILAITLGVSLNLVRRRWFVLGAVTLLMVLAGYCGALLVNRTLLGSPQAHPLRRMYSQLWPSFVLVAFIPLRSLEELSLEPADTDQKRKKKNRTT